MSHLRVHHAHDDGLAIIVGPLLWFLPVHAQLAQPAEVLRLALNAFSGQLSHHIASMHIHHHQRTQCSPARQRPHSPHGKLIEVPLPRNVQNKWWGA
jgi:hypothetical protein